MNKISTILLVNDCLSKGGKERRLLELIKGLTQLKKYRIVLAIISDIVEYEYVYTLPIDFIIIKRDSSIDFKALIKLKNVIKRFSPDLIHSWGDVSSVYLTPLVLYYRLRFINGIVADSPNGLNIFNRRYFYSRLTFPVSDRIISNSKAGIKAYKAPIKKTFCIYNGIDLSRFKNLTNSYETKKTLLGDGSEKYSIVGMVAAFEERKDYETLINAALSIIDNDPLVRFILVGGGAKLDSCKALVSESYRNKIVFTGKRQDVESIVQIFDVGVLLTNINVHGEGISNSIIEYMALGKPVIATMGGGTDEVVYDNINGFRIPAFSVEDLIKKIKLLLMDKNLANQMGSEGRKLVTEQFSLATMTSSFTNLYQALIDK